MNIMLVTNQLTMGGAEKMVVRLATELCARHDVVVVSQGGPLAEALPSAVPHVTVDLRTKTPQALASAAWRLRALMREHRTEFVHAHSPNTAIATRLARTGRPIPVLASAHGSWVEWKKPLVARGFALGADLVVGCSRQMTQELIRHGLPAHKTTTVHNGIPYDPDAGPDPDARSAIRAELGIAPDAPLLLAVGRVIMQKGFGDLLQAMGTVKAFNPRVRLAIAGDGEHREALRAMAVELGLTQEVIWLGNRDDVGRLLAAADMFCLPSHFEGLPLAIAEAMAAGLPVVSTHVGGVPEIVEHGRTGLLVQPGAPTELAQALVALLASPPERRSFGEAGRARVADQFTLRRMAANFEALYDSQTRRAGAARLA